MRLAKVLGALGRSCITVGTLLLLFVAYQLWGTGIREAQAQTKITREFHKTLDDVIDGSIPDTAAAISAVPEGEPTAIIDIPKINVHKTVVEGVGIPDLKKGPGHYPGTPLPGQKGNAAIAGHRTTYGAPFNRVDELKPGDTINVQTVQGKWRYVVKETQIVSPTQVEVLEDKGDNRLTLTACHPKYSAKQRIVVVAELGPNQIPVESTATTKIEGNLNGVRSGAWPAVLLGILCAAIWAFAWALGRIWKKWPSYALGLPFFLVALFFFFEEFSRLLPANF
jgi:sortase A